MKSTITRRHAIMLSGAFGASAALGLQATSAIAQSASWDFADEYNLSTNRAAAELFISEVAKRSNSELAISYQPGAVLGLKSADHIDAVEDGSVQMALTLSTQNGGLDPLFNVTSLPFLVRDFAQSRQLWEIIRPDYQAIMEKHNQKIIWTLPSAPAGVWSRNPILSVDDLKGLRIRSFDATSTRTFANAGAAPLQLAFGDVIPQLSAGAIDALITSIDGGRQVKIWEHTPNFTALNYSMALFIIHVNLDAYNALSDRAKTAVEEASVLAENLAWELTEASVESGFAELEAAGGKAHRQAPDDVLAALREAARPIREEWSKSSGERGQRILDQLDAAS